MIIDAIKEELESLVVDGTLDPERVVEAARNPNSSMHKQFDWDDSSAAHEHRIAQARALIKRVKVNVIRTDNEVVRVASYIRSPTGSGYESTQQVAIRHVDRLAVVIITLATCITMLRNLAAPEVDQVVNDMDALRKTLLAERDAA